MNILVIDGEKISDMKQLHTYIADQLHFPSYYGKNLDALYDCLTDLSDVEVYVRNYGELRERLGAKKTEALMEVFLDVCAAKPMCALHVAPAKSTEAETFEEIFDETREEEAGESWKNREEFW